MNKYKLLRIRLKYTQKKMASVLGFSQSCISKIESGKLKPSFEYLQALKEILKQDVNDYL